MTQNPGIGSSITVTGTISTKTPLTGAAPTAATVTGSSSQVVAANASRKGLILTNTSSDTLSFGIGANNAVLNSGIVLPPYGVWEADEYSYVTSAINAISTGTSSNLSIQEFM